MGERVLGDKIMGKSDTLAELRVKIDPELKDKVQQVALSLGISCAQLVDQQLRKLRPPDPGVLNPRNKSIIPDAIVRAMRRDKKAGATYDDLVAKYKFARRTCNRAVLGLGSYGRVKSRVGGRVGGRKAK